MSNRQDAVFEELRSAIFDAAIEEGRAVSAEQGEGLQPIGAGRSVNAGRSVPPRHSRQSPRCLD
jgi:hypothetical protein